MMSSHGFAGLRRARSRGAVALLYAIAAVVVLALLAVIAVPVAAAMGGAIGAAPAPAASQTSSPAASATPAAPRPTETTATPPSPTAAAPPTTPPPASTPDAQAARAALERLETVDGRSITRYYREAFGQAWYDQDRNGCDTRNDILRRDLTQTVIKEGTGGCKVLSGVLEDVYTGTTVNFVSGKDTSVLVQIDHVVPLSWAWRHGAESWSEDDLRAFANDPLNLLASVGSVNQSKSDSGPGEWMPPSAAAHCFYAQRYIAVLAKWRLGVEPADRSALETALETCR